MAPVRILRMPAKAFRTKRTKCLRPDESRLSLKGGFLFAEPATLFHSGRDRGNTHASFPDSRFSSLRRLRYFRGRRGCAAGEGGTHAGKADPAVRDQRARG